MAFWCYLSIQNFAINVQIFIAQMMRADWHGMILTLQLIGQRLWVNIKEMHLQRVIRWKMEVR